MVRGLSNGVTGSFWKQGCMCGWIGKEWMEKRKGRKATLNGDWKD